MRKTISNTSRSSFKKLRKADLKLKESKCNFFKKEIHYLGHLISVSGIQPLPEKLDSIRNIPKPRSPKEIKQFLGLTSYYRKFVPRFSDMARPLTKLLAHDCEFEWTKQCDISFQMLKDTLCLAPILKYPDKSKPYHCTLMQANMVGQEYSLKATHPPWMEKQLLWTTPCHMSVVYFVAVS